MGLSGMRLSTKNTRTAVMIIPYIAPNTSGLAPAKSGRNQRKSFRPVFTIKPMTAPKRISIIIICITCLSSYLFWLFHRLSSDCFSMKFITIVLFPHRQIPTEVWVLPLGSQQTGRACPHVHRPLPNDRVRFPHPNR